MVLLLNHPAAITLAAITYHLLADPTVLAKLRAELLVAIPDPASPPPYPTIEALPYLTAVVQEGLRLHPAGSLRMQRIAPTEDLVYTDPSTGKTWLIPAGTTVSMTAKLLHQLEDVWGKDHNEYRPERWLGENGRRLGKHLMTFSKGSRICLGSVLLHHSFLQLKLPRIHPWAWADAKNIYL